MPNSLIRNMIAGDAFGTGQLTPLGIPPLFGLSGETPEYVDDEGWQDTTNTEPAQNGLSKSAATNAWDAAGRSKKSTTDGGVKTTVQNDDSQFVLGLGSTAVGTGSGQFNTGLFAVYKNGTTDDDTLDAYYGDTLVSEGVATVANGDTIEIVVISGTVTLLHNGENVYEWEQTPHPRMAARLAIFTSEYVVPNVELTGGTWDVAEDTVFYPLFPTFQSRDEKTAGTHGGSVSATTPATRVLNTTVINDIIGASLATNQITLAAGTYWVEAESVAYSVGPCKMYLYNVSDLAVALVGMSNYSADVSGTSADVITFRGVLELDAEKVFEVRLYPQNAETTFGLGVASNIAVTEVFARVTIFDLEVARKVLHVRDSRDANTPGGGSSVGVQTRTINTVVYNNIFGASLDSNLITLPAGSYFVDMHAVALQVDRHRAYLYDETNEEILLLGDCIYSRNFQSAASPASRIMGVVVLEAETEISVKHYTETAFATNGLGLATNNAMSEVYLDGVFWQLPTTAYEILHVRETKSTGTNGGASVIGVQTRVLNTIVTNTIPGASLSGSIVTLPSGDYRIVASASAYQTVRTKAILYNETSESNIEVGLSMHNGGTRYASVPARIDCYVTLAEETNISLRMYAEAVIDPAGLGVAVSDGNDEVYSELWAFKL